MEVHASVGRGGQGASDGSQAILQVQAVAREFPQPAVPVAVVAGERVSLSVAEQVGPLEEQDDLMDRLLKHHAGFRRLLQQRLHQRTVPAAEAERHLSVPQPPSWRGWWRRRICCAPRGTPRACSQRPSGRVGANRNPRRSTNSTGRWGLSGAAQVCPGRRLEPANYTRTPARLHGQRKAGGFPSGEVPLLSATASLKNPATSASSARCWPAIQPHT